jgi:inositol transport system substrate-binding protein
MKSLFCLLLVIWLGVFAAGCSSTSTSTSASGGKPESGKQLVIGVAMPDASDKWLTYLQDGMKKYADSQKDVKLIFSDAQNDANKQLSQVENYISQKVNAVVIVPVDTTSAPNIVNEVNNAKIPIIVVNRQYNGVDKATAYVGSDSLQSGTMEMEEVAKLMNGKGNIAIMDGQMGHDAQIKRTQGNKEIIKKNKDMKVVLEGTGDFDRAKGMALMENWLQSGKKIDAVVSNNDEMAIGAIMALKDAGKLNNVLVAGIDATPDALKFVKDGELKVTVFQDARGQGKGGIETAIKVAKGEKVEKFNWIPYELVTKDNVDTYIAKWK